LKKKHFSAEAIQQLIHEKEWRESTLKAHLGVRKAVLDDILHNGTEDPKIVSRLNAIDHNLKEQEAFSSEDFQALMSQLGIEANDIACHLDISRSAVGRMASASDDYDVSPVLRKLLRLMVHLENNGIKTLDLVSDL
jgi:DNA-binding Xre family transcriptional regulator